MVDMKTIFIASCVLMLIAICLVVKLFIDEQRTLKELQEIKSELTKQNLTNPVTMEYLDSMEQKLSNYE